MKNCILFCLIFIACSLMCMENNNGSDNIVPENNYKKLLQKKERTTRYWNGTQLTFNTTGLVFNAITCIGMLKDQPTLLISGIVGSFATHGMAILGGCLSCAQNHYDDNEYTDDDL